MAHQEQLLEASQWDCFKICARKCFLKIGMSSTSKRPPEGTEDPDSKTARFCVNPLQLSVALTDEGTATICQVYCCENFHTCTSLVHAQNPSSLIFIFTNCGGLLNETATSQTFYAH